MEKVYDKKPIGTALLLLFATSFFYSLYHIVIGATDNYRLYDHFITKFMWVVADGACLGVLLYAAIKKSWYLRGAGRIAAYILAGLYCIGIIDTVIDANVYAFMGDYSWLIMSIVYFILYSMLLLCSRVWIATKIIGIAKYIIPLFSNLIIVKMRDASESHFNFLMGILKIVDLFALILTFTLLILAIIWLCIRPKKRLQSPQITGNII